MARGRTHGGEVTTKKLTGMSREDWNRPNTTIAKECGCSHTLVRRTRKKLGICPYIQKQRIDWDQYDALLRSDMDNTQIANIIGCDRSTVFWKRNVLTMEPERPSRPSPGRDINRIICGNRIVFNEIEDAILILSRFVEDRITDKVIRVLIENLKSVLKKMEESGRGEKPTIPPTAMPADGKNRMLKMKQMFGIPENLKTKMAINRVIRDNIAGGDIFLDAMTGVHGIQRSRSIPNPDLDEVLETLRFARHKMADVIMDFVSQEDKK